MRRCRRSGDLLGRLQSPTPGTSGRALREAVYAVKLFAASGQSLVLLEMQVTHLRALCEEIISSKA